MAEHVHLRIIAQGVEAWNAWRHQYPQRRPDLSDADLTGARMGRTIFSSNDLSVAKGVDSVVHVQPSTIGLDTLCQSGGRIPDGFLRSCQVPEEFITFLPSLIQAQEAIQFYSCFISYSSKDEDFARRLRSRFRSEKLRVWFAPEDIRGGEKLHEQIERAIKVHDKLLLVLSESSMKSEWVITEIRNARAFEIQENKRKLFPIRLTKYDDVRAWKCFDSESGKDLAIVVREYYIPDFSNWANDEEFEAAFGRLLRDLQLKQG